MITLTTASVDETRAVAAAIAELLGPGDLVLLVGDLGAGKTAFTQGLGEALGVTDPITSPTFTLRHDYRGRLPLHHLDVYRLEHLAEVLDLDLPDLLEGDGVTVVEWGDAIGPVLPGEFLEVRLTLGRGDDDRVINLRLVGTRWSARTRALTAVVEPWRTTTEDPTC